MEQLSFKTKIGYDDIQNQFEYLMQKQRDTIKLLCNNTFGIVSSLNTSGSDSSLFPTIDGNTLNFTSGKLVTNNGNFIELPSFSVSIPSINQDTIVLYTYSLVGSSEKRLSNNGKAYPVFFVNEEPSKCVRFLTLENYNLLTSTVLNDSVCLAILKYSSNDILLDVTKNQYSFNRPWFSLCDIEHRNSLGSGSSSVPHSIGLNDLTSSDLTIYDQLLTRGIIISKDTGIAGIPGKIYQNETPYTIELEDGTSNKIIKLEDCYPNAIASVYDVDGNEIACHLLKGSNTILIDDETEAGTQVNVQMCVTNTLISVAAESQVNELKFKSQDSDDTIITQGLEVKLQSTEVSFNDCSNFDRNFEIVVNKDGTIHKEPEILCPSQKTSNYANYTISQEFDIPVRLQFWFVSAFSEKITLRVYGDIYDSSEEYEEITIPENTNGQFTTKYFTKITKITSEDVGETSSSMVVFAYSNRPLDRRLRIANLTWNKDSQTFTNVKDIRPISTVIRDPFKISVVKEAAANIINTLNVKNGISSGFKYKPILIEDFNSPEYLDLNSVTWITSGKGINFPLIEKYIVDTSSYTLCYRSRKLNLQGADTIYAYLVGADLETINSYPVRLIYKSGNTLKEEVFEQKGNGLFVLYSAPATYGKILVTGSASGVAVFCE